MYLDENNESLICLAGECDSELFFISPGHGGRSKMVVLKCADCGDEQAVEPGEVTVVNDRRTGQPAQKGGDTEKPLAHDAFGNATIWQCAALCIHSAGTPLHVTEIARWMNTNGRDVNLGKNGYPTSLLGEMRRRLDVFEPDYEKTGVYGLAAGLPDGLEAVVLVPPDSVAAAPDETLAEETPVAKPEKKAADPPKGDIQAQILAAEVVIRESGGQAHIQDIARTLEGRGFNVKKYEGYPTPLYDAIRKSSKFLTVGKAIFALANGEKAQKAIPDVEKMKPVAAPPPVVSEPAVVVPPKAESESLPTVDAESEPEREYRPHAKGPDEYWKIPLPFGREAQIRVPSDFGVDDHLDGTRTDVDAVIQFVELLDAPLPSKKVDKVTRTPWGDNREVGDELVGYLCLFMDGMLCITASIATNDKAKTIRPERYGLFMQALEMLDRASTMKNAPEEGEPA
jgi:hypothetical protein